MPAPTIDDAKATARLAMLDAITKTCHETGLRADDATELLLDALIDAVQHEPTRWAFVMLALEGPVTEAIKLALATVDDALDKSGVDVDRLPKRDPMLMRAYREEALIEARIWLFRALGREAEPEDAEQLQRPKNKKKRKDKKRKKRGKR